MMASKSDSFWRLTEAEHVKARAFCRRLMGNREDGDDLYHDTLVTARTRFNQLRDRAAFRPWLYRIAVNSFKNRMRSNRLRRATSLTSEVAERLSGSDPDAVQAAKRRIEWAFRAVTPEERAMIVLHEVEGWQMSEIARLFGKREGAVKMRLSRARRKMRQAIVKRFHRSQPKALRSVAESEDGVCVAVRPSED